MESFYREIEDVVYMLKKAKDEGINVNLLIGAGCSVTAGIPSAQGLIYEIRKRYSYEYKRIKNKDYASCMSILTREERKRLIMEFVNKAKINWAHLSIAQLMKYGYINRIVTTNFDNLLIRACSLVDEFPGIYDLATSNGFKSELLFDKSILYLHGQYTGFVLCNTGNEINNQKEILGQVFSDLNKDSMWIIAGYSGQNDAILNLLINQKTFDNRLFWIGYNDNEPTEILKEKLLCEDKYAFYVKGFDADSFFVTLTQKLGCFPPKLIEKPFTYLSNRLDELTEYKLKSDDPFIDCNFVQVATDDIIQMAIKNIEDNKVLMVNHYLKLNMLDKVLEILSEENDEEVSEKLLENFASFFKCRVENARKYIEEFDVEAYKEDFEVQSKLAEAYKAVADETSDDNEKKYLICSCNKYEIISNLVGNKDINILNSWASILQRIGQIDKQSKDSLGYYKKAQGKYEIISQIEPDNIENILNLAEIYFEESMFFKEDEDVINDYLEKCLKMFKNAYDIDCNSSKVLVNWAICLVQMTLISENNCEKLIGESNKKFKEAFEIDTKDLSVLVIWAKTLFRIINRNINDDIKIKYIDIAVEKLKLGLNLSNDKKLIIDEWKTFIEQLIELKLYNDKYINYYSNFFAVIEDEANSLSKQYIDLLIREMNQDAYTLIIDNEFIISKLILDNCLKFDTNETFHFATVGLWYFRNKDLDIPTCEEKGIEFYKKAINKNDKQEDKINAEALLQKLLIEQARFNYYRKNDEKKGANFCKEAYEMGIIDGYDYVYEDYLELLKEINYKDDNAALTLEE